MSGESRALPAIDADSSPFWEGTTRHELLVQRCGSCSTLRFPPRPICSSCHSTELAWAPMSGHGRVLSWAVAHQRFHPSFGEVPYTVVLVELAEQPGLAMYGAFQGDPAALRVGTAVEAVFADVTDGTTLVNWSPGSS